MWIDVKNSLVSLFLVGDQLSLLTSPRRSMLEMRYNSSLGERLWLTLGARSEIRCVRGPGFTELLFPYDDDVDRSLSLSFYHWIWQQQQDDS